MTAGGNCLDCPYNVRSLSVSMTNAKLRINITISYADFVACYLGIDIFNFYLGTDIHYHQCMQYHPSKIPK